MAIRLWSLLLLVTTLLLPVTASAFAPTSAETRVGGFDFAATTLVGLSDTASLGTHQGNRHGYDQVASGETHAARGVAPTAERLVIGSGDELYTASGAIREGVLEAGETAIQFGRQATDKAAWAINSGMLRMWMRLGRPIRDASPHVTDKAFLNAERALLRSRGWKFDSATNLWMPPGG